MKVELRTYNKMLDEGFSLFSTGDNKRPNIGSWKPYQTEAPSKDAFEKMYLKPSTKQIATATGFNDLECIDVDLKVFSTAKEKKAFWDEYLSFLEDNILDFHEKFVIYKTQNEGFHILYRSKRVEGNLKVAVLKGHTEAIIETRGKGGYIVLYNDREVNNRTYIDIDYISDEDRNILFQCSKCYNYIEEVEPIEYKPKKDTKHNTEGLTPWEDFNNRNTVWEIIQDGFTIVRRLSDKLIVKRSGATSAHSGYIYLDKDLLYLFSTGTILPHEKQLSAYSAYTFLRFNGDFSASAKELYSQGYGDRMKPEPLKLEPTPIIETDLLKFPIEVFPTDLAEYILQCEKTLNSSLDYMGSSLLFLTSLIVGNSMKIEVKPGWYEYGSLWLVLVGRAGIGKTPSINNMVAPIQKMNSKEIKQYAKDYEKYEIYENLDKKDKKNSEDIQKPYKKQFIVNDVTLEALADLHEQNKNGVGVIKDELAGWIKEMNKYRQGSDLEHWLSSWSGKEINLTRKTAKSSFVEKAFIPVMGGIQPEILNSFYTEDNKTNGFIDRMLFSFPDLEVTDYNMDNLSTDLIEYYSAFISSFYTDIKKMIKYNDDYEIDSKVIKLSPEANLKWVEVFNRISGTQNDDNVNEYMKSMLPKQKSYIPRFALLMHVLHEYYNGGNNYETIGVESIERAEKLSNYFTEMARKIKVDTKESVTLKQASESMKGKDSFDVFKAMYKANPNVNKSKTADILGVSRQTVYNFIKDIKAGKSV